MRDSPDREPSFALKATAVQHHRAVERVISAMRRRLDENLSLKEMADIAYMSPFHFNRIFRQLTGVPPCQFLSALRLESARRLLLTTELKVTDICFEVGYNSLGTFIRRFSDLLGASPRSLRRLADRPPNVPAAGPAAEPRPSRADLRGGVAGPADFRGVIFIGLFDAPIPQGQPVACAVLGAPGRFRIAAVPDGSYHLFAAGLTGVQESAGLFLYDTALRAGGQLIHVREGLPDGGAQIELTLRPPLPTDPPILMTFPAWWGRTAAPEPRGLEH